MGRAALAESPEEAARWSGFVYVYLIGGGVSPRVQHIQPLHDDAVVCSDGRRCRYGVLEPSHDCPSVGSSGGGGSGGQCQHQHLRGAGGSLSLVGKWGGEGKKGSGWDGENTTACTCRRCRGKLCPPPPQHALACSPLGRATVFFLPCRVRFAPSPPLPIRINSRWGACPRTVRHRVRRRTADPRPVAAQPQPTPLHGSTRVAGAGPKGPWLSGPRRLRTRGPVGPSRRERGASRDAGVPPTLRNRRYRHCCRRRRRYRRAHPGRRHPRAPTCGSPVEEGWQIASGARVGHPVRSSVTKGRRAPVQVHKPVAGSRLAGWRNRCGTTRRSKFSDGRRHAGRQGRGGWRRRAREDRHGRGEVAVFPPSGGGRCL